MNGAKQAVHAWVSVPKEGGGVRTTLTGLLLAAVILFGGTLLGGGVREKGGSLLAEQVFLRQGIPPEADHQLLQAQTIKLLREYLLAFADAAISFNTVPKFDTRIIYDLAICLPEDVEVAEMAFDGYDIILHCTAREALSPTLLGRRLLETGQMEAVRVSTPEMAEDGLWRFTVTCQPIVAAGQLNMDWMGE